MTSEIEAHPYNDAEDIPTTTTLLIIGTAPNRHDHPRDVTYFYGSRQNQLWSKIVPALYNRKFIPDDQDLRPKMTEIVRTMQAFLKQHGFWMHDVLQQYGRRHGNADDRNLEAFEVTKFRPIFERLIDLRTLLFTGACAETLTGSQLENEDLIDHGEFKLNGKPTMPRIRLLKIRIDGAYRDVTAHTLPSPSNAANRAVSLENKIEMYRRVLCA